MGYDDTNLDVYIPFFLLLQFIFYFGWLKVLFLQVNIKYAICGNPASIHNKRDRDYLLLVSLCLMPIEGYLETTSQAKL